MGMENFSVAVFCLGILLFGLLMAILWLEEKIPSIKDTRPIKWVSQIAMNLMLLCIPVFIVSVVIEYANQPSGYEVCMDGIDSSTDPEAIAWMEDYCYQRNSG